MNGRTLGLLAWLCLPACGDDDEHPPLVSAMDAGIRCAFAPDAATPLGVSALDLWSASEGSYELSAAGARREEGRLRWLGPGTFSISVARTDEAVAGLDDCRELAAPVRVRVTSGTFPLDASALGVVRGSPSAFSLEFRSPAGTEPPSFVIGLLKVRAGLSPELDLFTDSNTKWQAPPPASEVK